MKFVRQLSCVVFATSLSACLGPPGSASTQQTPTDAEVEAYNARVDPEERIVCRTETPVGSFIPRRVCRLQAQVDSASDQTRTELRRVLR